MTDAVLVVDLVPGSANVTGSLELRRYGQGVILLGKVVGLAPGLHGFHVHMTGDTGNTCKAAGGHFNPDMVDLLYSLIFFLHCLSFQNDHSSPYSPMRHAGDLGNILTHPDLPVTLVHIYDAVISLGDGGPRDVEGRAIVIHAGEDDLGRGEGDKAEESKKTGNAGSRVACGIIKLVD